MRTILITGASSGIGKATAKYFAERDWKVIATMRSPENENELTQMSNVTVLPLDVTDEVSIQQAVSQSGPIDVLLNNAGYGAIGPIEGAEYEDYFNEFNTNLFGYIRMINAVAPQMRERGNGIIINISSMAELTGSPYGSLYHSSKWAVAGLSESIMYELEEYGVRVKTVLPPIVKTDFWTRSLSVFRKTNVTKYEEGLDKSLWLNLDKINKIGIEPIEVSKVIYKAATDGKKRLRYSVGSTAAMRFFKRFLPDFLVFRLVKKF